MVRGFIARFPNPVSPGALLPYCLRYYERSDSYPALVLYSATTGQVSLLHVHCLPTIPTPPT